MLSLAGGFNWCQRAALERTGGVVDLGSAVVLAGVGGLAASIAWSVAKRRCRSPAMMRRETQAKSTLHVIQSQSIFPLHRLIEAGGIIFGAGRVRNLHH